MEFSEKVKEAKPNQVSLALKAFEDFCKEKSIVFECEEVCNIL